MPKPDTDIEYHVSLRAPIFLKSLKTTIEVLADNIAGMVPQPFVER